MYGVFTCIVTEHDLRLVALAFIVCLCGVWATLSLLTAQTTAGRLQRFAWCFLAALTAGSSIWATHFVAMLAYEPHVPASFDPVVTIESLIVAIAGTLIAFLVAKTAPVRPASALGGALMGLAVSAMHYLGMRAYLLDAIVDWDRATVAASVAFAVGLGALALALLTISSRHRVKLAATAMVLSILLLHFTGMDALRVTPLLADPSRSDPRAFYAMALAVALIAVLVSAAGIFSYLIDRDTRGVSSRKLAFLSENDVLTGLPNRASFGARLTQELALRAPAEQVAAIVIDIDRFETINEIRGHRTGDRVLRIIANRVGELASPACFIARTGGDEFSAVLRFTDRADLDDFVARLREALCTRIDLKGVDIRVDGKIGVSVGPEDADDAEALTGTAQLALTRAKSDPLRTVCFYDRGMDETMRGVRALANDLRNAIERDELELHYQVQKSVRDGSITGYETLVRWTHPEHGAVPPSTFVPIAEKTGSILPLGEWVLRSACREAASWTTPIRIAVNLSPAQFASPDLPSLVRDVLEETGLAPSRLELELTETAFFHDRERALRMLGQIKALGVAISLDDFGAGYSSLDTLRSFRFDKIKLDRSFLCAIDTDPSARAIIRAVLSLAREMETPVLAEGVETMQQFEFLRAGGCDEAQGYLLGRPQPVSAIGAVSGRLAMTGT